MIIIINIITVCYHYHNTHHYDDNDDVNNHHHHQHQNLIYKDTTILDSPLSVVKKSLKNIFNTHTHVYQEKYNIVRLLLSQSLVQSWCT